MIIVTKMAELVKRFCGKCHFMKNKVEMFRLRLTPPLNMTYFGKAAKGFYCHFDQAALAARGEISTLLK